MGRVQYDPGTGPKPSNPKGVAANAAATATAKYVQSFDELSITVEQPAKAAPWVPRGNPQRYDLPMMDSPPKGLSIYDDRQNLRADGKVLVRETPDSKKTDKDARPNGLRVYREQAGETIS